MESARRLAGSNDTRVLLAGVGAFVGLLTYLAVAFATTHAVPVVSVATSPSVATTPSGATTSANLASEVAPFTPSNSNLTPIPRGRGRRFAVRVTPVSSGGYGALVPTLVANPPPGHRFVVGLWLRGSRPGQIGILLDKFRPGATSVYLVDTTVPATLGWHHVTFSRRVRGQWLGLGLFVSRVAGAPTGEARHHVGDFSETWFEVRDLTVRYH